MFLDAGLILSSAQSITTAAASTNLYDVSGAGSGNPTNLIIGNATVFGADIGNGDGATSPIAYWTVTTTGTGTGTVAFGIEAAIDNGSNAPGTWVRLATTQAFVGTALLAGDIVTITIPPFAPVGPGMGRPRFYRFYYDQTGNGAVHVTGAIVLNPPLGYQSTQNPNNFLSV